MNFSHWHTLFPKIGVRNFNTLLREISISILSVMGQMRSICKATWGSSKTAWVKRGCGQVPRLAAPRALTVSENCLLTVLPVCRLIARPTGCVHAKHVRRVNNFFAGWIERQYHPTIDALPLGMLN
jgi:hypothetical protein